MLAVTASILNQCSVGDATLALGQIGLVDASGKMTVLSAGASAGIPWACTHGTTASLAFGAGSHSSGTDRRMKATAVDATDQFLEYQLKVGSANGAPIAGSAISLSGADGTNKTFTIWGGPVDSAANRLAKPAGEYSDTVLLTVTFSP